MKAPIFTPRPGTQLLDLPNELLEAIALSFDSLSRHGFESSLSIDRARAKTKFKPREYYENRLGLANLCKASRRLRDICQPILYEEFVPTRPAELSMASLPYIDTMRPNVFDERLYLFVMECIRRPDLAVPVKRVHLSADILMDTPEQMGWATVKMASKMLRFNLGEFVKLWNAEYLLTRNVLPEGQRCSQITGAMLVAILIGVLPRLHHFSIQSGWLQKRLVPPRAIQMVCGKESIPLRILDVSNFWTGYIYQHIHPHKWARTTSKTDARFDEQKEDMVRQKSLEDWPSCEPVDLEEGNDLLCRIGL
ncbi:hypothetical protein QBC44DRAFT_402583 [Cladorrhinum sp. PSN332]|nr:hypothetical protein QBC44DRAFT_402583 [Cladorrhinum sp. PSN332]